MQTGLEVHILIQILLENRREKSVLALLGILTVNYSVILTIVLLTCLYIFRLF